MRDMKTKVIWDIKRSNEVSLKKVKLTEECIKNYGVLFINEAINTRDPVIVNLIAEKIKNGKSDFYINLKDSKDILLNAIKTCNTQIIDILMDKVFDQELDILNQKFNKVSNIEFTNFSRKTKKISPLLFVLDSNIFNEKDAERIAINLIENGANVNDTTENIPPIEIAVKKLYPEVVRMLIDNDAYIGDISENKKLVNEIDNLARGSEKLKSRAEQIKKDITESQLKSYFENTFTREILEYIEQDEEITNIFKDIILGDILDKTNNSYARLKQLMGYKEFRSQYQQYILLAAIKSKNLDIFKMITSLPQIDVNASIQVQKDVIFDGLSFKNIKETSPLMLVLSLDDTNFEQQEDFAMFLIRECNADIGVTRKEAGTNLLDLALENDLSTVTRELVKKNAEAPDISNFNFELFMEEFDENYEEVPGIQRLRGEQIKKYFEDRFTDEQLDDIGGNENLQYFFMDLANRDFTDFEKKIENIDITKYGNHLLEKALISGSVDNIKAVLDKGVDVNTFLQINDDVEFNSPRMESAKVITPLMFAIAATTLAKNKKNEIVKYLLDCGAEVELTADPNGVTALQSAGRNGLNRAVLELIKRGASLNNVDDFGVTPLECASDCLKRHEKEELLEKVIDFRDEKMNTDITKIIDEALQDKNLNEKEFVCNLLGIQKGSLNKENNVRLFSHLYSLDGVTSVEGKWINEGGWDGGIHPIIYRMYLMLALAKDIKNNKISDNQLSKVEKDTLLELIKSEMQDSYNVFFSCLNVNDSFVVNGMQKKKMEGNVARRYADKIKSLKTGETFSVYAGTRAHAMYLVFERNQNNRIELTRYNLGLASKFHETTSDNRILPYKVQLAEGDEYIDKFMRIILEWENIDCGCRSKRYDEDILKFFEKRGGERIHDGIQMKRQTADNCSLKNDTAARVGRILSKLRLKEEYKVGRKLTAYEDIQIKKKTRKLCKYLKEWERKAAKEMLIEDGTLTKREINRKIEESVLNRLEDIVQDLEGNWNNKLVRLSLKREFINFLKKRSKVQIDEETEHDEKFLNKNIIKLFENLDPNIEYLNTIKIISLEVMDRIKDEIKKEKKPLVRSFLEMNF